MRNFSWFVFAVTGDVDAYLLYKASEQFTHREENDRTKEKNHGET